MGFSFVTCPKAQDRPNILWIITMKDLSPIYGCYGDSLARTPGHWWIGQKEASVPTGFFQCTICAPARSTLSRACMPFSWAPSLALVRDPCAEFHWNFCLRVMRGQAIFTATIVKTDIISVMRDDGTEKPAIPPTGEIARKAKPFFQLFFNLYDHPRRPHPNALRKSDTESLTAFYWPWSGNGLPPVFSPDSPQKWGEIWAHYVMILLAVFDQASGRATCLQLEGRRPCLEEDHCFSFFSDHAKWPCQGTKRWLQ